ncbi:TetR/AcrR family transcriptional regulator [Pseudonocardia sp. TRM90224]|uniref:TetR/AcrR family transcriptional regulator n=1 Tax=Pseudonocardia sp. TRM90224 TaxID=2812678 RepID=UPI001E362462|nr:TetR/AcrR family transcriptional regulator [Pseudonocardia sp. TRM90224]
MTVDVVPERVRDVLASRGETQRDLAAAIGMEPTKLSKSLNGLRRFRTDELAAIAEQAGVTVDWLMHGTGAGPRRATVVAVPAGDDDPRTRLLNAAWRLIAARGYHSVRIADIASACSTSSAAVHYYFPTKADVLEAALSHCMEAAFARQSAELVALESGRDRMLRLIEMQLPVGQVRDEWSVWLQFWAESAVRPALRSAHTAFYGRWREAVERIIERGRRQGQVRDIDAKLVALQLTSLTDGLGIQVLTEAPGVTAQTMRAALLAFVEREIFLPA